MTYKQSDPKVIDHLVSGPVSESDAPMTDRLSELTQRNYEQLATKDAARWLALKANLGTSSNEAVLGYFEQRYPASPFVLQRKAAVPPVGIGSGGSPLLPPSTDPIIALIQQQTLPVRMNLPKVPFGVPVPVQTTPGTYAWVLQGQSKPASRVTWTDVTNPLGKIAGIVPLSRELVKLSPGAENIMTAALVGGAVYFSDKSFLDPTVTYDVNGRPASITNGVTPITATGTSLPEKVRDLLAALFAGRPQTHRAALIATPAVATALAAGESISGMFSGVPVFATPAAGSLVIAADAAGIIFSDDGGVVDVSEQATVALDDAPTGTTVLTSFWQTNLVGFRVERMTWWQKVEPNAVVTLAVA